MSEAEMTQQDALVALQDFRALCSVARCFAQVSRQAQLRRGRQKMARAYFHFMCSITDALFALTADDPLGAKASWGFPRLPYLASLTRQLLEAYAWFRFFASDAKSDEEYSFGYLVGNIWAHTDYLRQMHQQKAERMKFEPPRWRSGPECRRICVAIGKKQRFIRGLRQELRSHAFLKRLCAECKRYWAKTTKGFWPARDSVLEAAGMGSHLRVAEYDYLSAHTHAAPSAVMAALLPASSALAEHTTFFHPWAGVMALTLKDMLAILPSCACALDQSQKDGIDQCAAHYRQFIAGSAATKARPKRAASSTCPTCWLRPT